MSKLINQIVMKETISPEQLIAKPSYSLSASLTNTRELVTEILDEKKAVASKAPNKLKSTARVLKSTEYLAKGKEEKEEEEQKLKSVRKNV